MVLQANQKYIDTSNIAHLLVNGEKNVDIINLQVDRYYHNIDLSTCEFILRAVNENQNLIDQTLEKSIFENNIILKWTINEYFTAVDGKLLLEIRAIQGDNLILKYVMSPIYVKSSATGEGLPSLDTVEKALDEMQELLKQAQDIAIKTPYIENNTWWIWDIAQNMYVDTGISAQGQKGDTGEKGQDGLNGVNGNDGKDGKNGLSAYEIWLNQGNTGTETDFLNYLKGDKGEQGERGLQGEQGIQGVQGEKGDKGDTGERGTDGKDGTNGVDGISPTISIAENTSSSYILTITDANGSFNTPNLKGPSGSGTDITVDTEISETSENPLQNKAIAKNLSTIQAEIVKLNDLIKNLPSEETSVTTLFDSSNHEEYLDSFKFKDNQWGDSEYTFQQAIEKVNSLCSEDYNYQLRISSMFGWSANITILCLIPVQLNANSRLLINYNCSTTGSNITVEVLSSADFTSESVATFEDIPSIYVEDGLYMSINLFPKTTIESGTYYLRFKYTTVNPVFLIKSIEVIS